MAVCPVLKKKQAAKGVGLIKAASHSTLFCLEHTRNVNTGYKPFLSYGFVSLPGEEHLTLIRILRDTCTAHPFILEGVLPLSAKTKTGTSVLVNGFEMGFTIPCHQVNLKSSVVTGSIVGCIRSSLPIPGVAFVSGNDLADSNVWDKVGSDVLPQVVAVLGKPEDHECVQKYPDVFLACTVICAMVKKE